VLSAGIWLGAVTVTTPPAGAASDCLVTAVNVTVHNKTGSSLPVNSTRTGVTNKWCRLPGNPAGPRSVTNFEAGDNLFKTEVNVAYVAPNNDTLALQASSGYDGVESPGAHCTVVPNGRAPSPYSCSAKVHTVEENRGALLGLANTPVTKVDWEIVGP
jgi:hypothetical protein